MKRDKKTDNTMREFQNARFWNSPLPAAKPVGFAAGSNDPGKT
jgi:hypothetical protein